MKSFQMAGVLLLALCSIAYSFTVQKLLEMAADLGLEYDTPPSNIEVERPPYPYSFGDYSVVMDERSEMELICTAEGTPEPTFRWEYNGGPLKDDERMTNVNGVLTIVRPTQDDEGEYQCFATNKYGTALSSKYKAVYAFQQPFDDTTVIKSRFNEGEEATLECGPPDGAPKPRVYWTTFSDEIENLVTDDRMSYSAEGNLHFANIQESDGGSYFCFAANDLLGNFQRSPMHQVRVNSGDVQPRAATISELPDNVEGLRTEKFKIKCLASGFPTPQISWYRDGDELPGDSSGISLQKYNQDLVFRSLGFEDAGTYECRAENDPNVQPASATVHLQVNSAPYFQVEPEDIVIAPGESSEIVCNVHGVPAPTFVWLQNGGEIRDSESSVYQVVGEKIIINNVREGDSTVFQCVATNVHGEKVGSYTITVLAIPATIVEGPTPELVVSEDSSFELRCLTFGSPTPTVEWHMGGSKLESGGRIMITGEDGNSTLSVSGVVLEDAGVYECHALNSVDNSSQSSLINVRFPTSVMLTPETQYVIKGNSAEFTCDVTSDDRVEPVVSWYFQGTKLNPNKPRSEYALVGENVLRVMSAKATHTGTFECVAETDYDEDSASAELVVQAEPNAPYNVSVTINGLEALLSWTHPADNNADLQHYTIEYRTQYDDWPTPSDMAPWAEYGTISASTSSDMIPLRSYIEYSFRVTATNAVGTSQKSEVETAPMTPVAPPDEESMPDRVRSEATEPGKLTISWDPVHPYYHNGPDFEYVVKYRKEGETEWTEVVVDPEDTSFQIEGEEYENIEYSVGVRNSQDDGPDPEEDSGTTGQGVPSAAPGNVRLEAISSNAINVTWDPVPDDEVNGELLHYIIYYTRQSQQGSTETVQCPSTETSCVVGGLEAYSSYEVQVAVENGYRVGPKSAAQTIRTEEGVPSPSIITSFEATSYRLAVKWEPPVQENGIHLGYHLSIVEYDSDDEITKVHNETIYDIKTLMYTMDNANPATKYEVNLSAYTRVGDSTTEKADTKTGNAGKPVSPGKPKKKDPYKDQINITWVEPTAEGPLPDRVRACYKVKGSDEPCKYTEDVDVLQGNSVTMDDLEPGTEYEVFLEFENQDGTTRGDLVVFKTAGTGKSGDDGGGFPSWFIALICIIIFLLLILLIICILKTQKGGKYNVSDKEKQLKDENAPLKNNDGFAEFNQDSEFPDDMDGSQDSLASNPDGSEGDSLKEYADDEDPSKFNEEGSFIEEYHDPKTRSTDVREGGTSTFV